jgi:hypothetical protein
VSGVRFEFDRNEFDRVVRQAANEGARKVAREFQRLLDDLAVTEAGKPLEEVKAALQSGWKRLGGELTDPELTRFAESLRNGSRIQMRPREI